MPKFNRRWYSKLYREAWANRSGKVPLYNATGPMFTDTTPWHGDYHFNETAMYPLMISNHADIVLPWLELLEDMLPMTQLNAREVYNCRGCCFTTAHYPIKTRRAVYTNISWDLGIEMTAMALKTFWEYYKYTGDLDYLRRHAYPMMREGALFYEDYVSLGQDGYYHIIPTVSQENWGITKNFEYNRDSIGALSQVKYHLLACAEAAEKLGCDGPERQHWKEIADHLAPYPTYKTDEGLIFVDVRDANPATRKVNLHADLSMITFGDQIHLDSDPELLEIAKRTFRIMYPNRRRGRSRYNGMIERRLGLEKKTGHFDAEDLLMSYTGRMHFFIGVKDHPDFRFDCFLAWGGFEVTAEKKNSNVDFIEITSLAGETCKFKNPWHPDPPNIIKVSDNTKVPFCIDGDTISFDTQPNILYKVCPAQ